jgi:peptidoglycan DL-endopeptidase LytF
MQGNKMTRKDTILIAVVINAGLLAILLATAVIYDTGKEVEQPEFLTTVIENKSTHVETAPIAAIAQSTGDEVDNVLKYYRPSSASIASEGGASESFSLQHLTREEEEVPQEELARSQKQTEIKVKKGDTLEKIAKANHTTIDAIKKLNHLESERLSIGQALKIPVKDESQVISPTVVVAEKKDKKPEAAPKAADEPVYYTIKSGDNPWKIAKQYNVNYEDIVRLNHLNEEKARNLKIGDRVRVK